MVRANLLIPRASRITFCHGYLTIQETNKKYQDMYKRSKKINENDIFIVADPDWTHPDHPYGLSFFSRKKIRPLYLV
jgi:phosphoenolpyruvate carboxykinase (ATP)